MTFHSILFDGSGVGSDGLQPEAPDFFIDLGLDRLVASITAGRQAYDLAPFFHAPLTDLGTIAYRHEVFRDLERPMVLAGVRSFAQKMRTVHEQREQADRSHYQHEKERWFLDSAAVYCDAVTGLATDLSAAEPRSRGLRALGLHLAAYIASEPFATLLAETHDVSEALRAITYSLEISGTRIRVSRYSPTPDYTADVVQTFGRFKQGAVKDYRFQFSTWPHLNHVEAALLDLVARLHPDVFGALDRHSLRHGAYLDATIARFDREVQFYVAYLEHVDRLRRAGLSFCYPVVEHRPTRMHARAFFDSALAVMLAGGSSPVVTNDFHLEQPERILVVSGPNQGGKTTFARALGQLHHLASLGCPVPGTDARVSLVDRVFSHFERAEDLLGLTGKLEADLVRIRSILELATRDSLLVLNESFGSTTVSDALFLNREVMWQIIERGSTCVAVTFLDELASLDEATVSMVSTVDPDDPTVRTFRIVRRPADGLAYAAAIARKYGLTYEGVRERLAR